MLPCVDVTLWSIPRTSIRMKSFPCLYPSWNKRRTSACGIEGGSVYLGGGQTACHGTLRVSGGGSEIALGVFMGTASDTVKLTRDKIVKGEKGNYL